MRAGGQRTLVTLRVANERRKAGGDMGQVTKGEKCKQSQDTENQGPRVIAQSRIKRFTGRKKT